MKTGPGGAHRCRSREEWKFAVSVTKIAFACCVFLVLVAAALHKIVIW